MAKTKKNNLLMISLLGIFLFGIILYLILKPKTNKSSNQGGEIQPIMIDSEIIRSGVFPETLRPGVFPETLRPVPQNVEGYYGSYVTDGNLTIKLITKYTGEDYYCNIYLYDDLSGELVQTYETNYVPFESSDGYVYIRLPKDSRNRQPLTKEKIKFNLNIISNSDSEIVFDLKKFQKSYAKPEYLPDSIPIIKLETLRPGVFPETLRPGVFPETLRPPGVQIVEGYAGSYVIDNILTIKLRTKYTGSDYNCYIEIYDDESGDYIMTYRVVSVPNSSKDGYVYIILPKDSDNKIPLPEKKIKFNLYITIGFSDEDPVFKLEKYLPPGEDYAKPVYDTITTLKPGVFPETLRPGVFPETLRPGVFPETLRPGVFPETLRPGVFPETLRPGVFPETLRPGVFPETLRPGVFPETLRPPGVQIVEGYAGSYVIDNILTIKLRTKYTGEGYEGNIELFDESGEYIASDVVRPIPLSSPDGFVYIILKDLPVQKIQFNLYIDGDKERKVVFDLPDYLPPGVKYAKPVYNPIITLKPVPPVTSKKPIPPVTTKKPLKICSGQLTLNSNKTDCCYKDETLLQSCTRANMNTITPNCVSRTSLPYDKNISCCNTRSTQGNPLKYDVICKPKV